MRTKIRFIKPVISALLKARFFEGKTPFFINWSITDKCLWRCLYCKIWKAPSEELTTGQILNLLDEFRGMGTKVINFTGGEPLLRHDIGSIVDYAYRKGILSILNCSGVLVSEKAAELKNAGAVKLSLDGPEDIHDSIRGEGSFRKAIEAASVINRMRKRLLLSYVLARHNLEYIDYILVIAKKLRAPVSFQPASQSILGCDEPNPLIPPIQEYKRAVAKLIVKKRQKVFYPYIFNSLAGLTHLYHWPTPRRIRCGGGLIFCRIDANGDIYLCAHHKDGAGLNCVSMGPKRAFYSLKQSFCDSCWCAGVIESNSLLSFKPDVFLNLIRMRA